MGYIIEYKSEIVKKPTKSQPNYRLWVLTCGFFCLFLLCSHLLWPDKLAILQALIFPEENSLEAFAECLQDGQSFSEAVEGFCQQVFGNG